MAEDASMIEQEECIKYLSLRKSTVQGNRSLKCYLQMMVTIELRLLLRLLAFLKIRSASSSSSLLRFPNKSSPWKHI